MEMTIAYLMEMQVDIFGLTEVRLKLVGRDFLIPMCIFVSISIISKNNFRTHDLTCRAQYKLYAATSNRSNIIQPTYTMTINASDDTDTGE